MFQLSSKKSPWRKIELKILPHIPIKWTPKLRMALTSQMFLHVQRPFSFSAFFQKVQDRHVGAPRHIHQDNSIKDTLSVLQIRHIIKEQRSQFNRQIFYCSPEIFVSCIPLTDLSSYLIHSWICEVCCSLKILLFLSWDVFDNIVLEVSPQCFVFSPLFWQTSPHIISSTFVHKKRSKESVLFLQGTTDTPKKHSFTSGCIS